MSGNAENAQQDSKQKSASVQDAMMKIFPRIKLNIKNDRTGYDFCDCEVVDKGHSDKLLLIDCPNANKLSNENTMLKEEVIRLSKLAEQLRRNQRDDNECNYVDIDECKPSINVQEILNEH